MPDQGAKSRNHRKRRKPDIGAHHSHREQRLSCIRKQRRGGGPAFAGAQHIGGANIARADAPDVACTGEPAKDQPEWNRTEQIGEKKRRQQKRPVAIPTHQRQCFETVHAGRT